jgi:hypothetical protein
LHDTAMHCDDVWMGPHPRERFDWARPDPEQMKRVARAVALLERRRRLQELYADIELKFIPPVLSNSEMWEAHWLPDGHVMAAEYGEMCRRVREALGIEVPE